MPVVTLKQGDTTPEFEQELELDRELTGDESIRFYMEHEESGTLVVNQPVTEVKESQNQVVYDFQEGDTSRLDMHHAEIVITWPDGEVQTLPNDQNFEVEIVEPVNRDVPPEQLDRPDINVGVVDADQITAPTLQAVETLTGSVTGDQTISSLVGENLSVENGALTAVDTDTNTERTDEEIEDVVGALLAGSGATTISYDDQAGTLTISSTDTDTDTQLTDEQVRDIVGAFVTGGGATTVAYDDADNTLTISSTDTNTQRSNEEIQDVVGALLTASGAASIDYDDQAGSLTINATDTNTQLDPGHHNPTYDSDEDGTIDADVDNTNTTTDALTVGTSAELPMDARTDETANRSSSSWYQNTTGKPLLVEVTTSNTSGGRSALALHVNDTESDNRIGADSDVGDGADTTYATVSTIVPPSQHYKISGTGIGKWSETTIG
ncbi:hypothetical protein [Halococcus sp. PRR34]|uniref:hypothetical protein n=1 Tax=Halococcus sp. PRR34 TaxID=3020830 RepID=UPI0023611A58|nr:hypothetical protein [Halococcus sp. PRR34]